jgi:CRISPR/Cas system-associated exonuclease Cas4 (RecB family)
MDTAIAELAAMRRVAVDSEDEEALQEVLEEIAEMRRELEP